MFVKLLPLFRESVRLGEWDTNSDTDCDRGDCSDPALDVPVEEIIPHENYNPNSKSQENDIALLRLSQSVTYSGMTDWKMTMIEHFTFTSDVIILVAQISSNRFACRVTDSRTKTMTESF